MGNRNGIRNEVASNPRSSSINSDGMETDQRIKRRRRNIRHEHQLYDGRKFYCEESGYWYATSKPKITMHRYVWMKERGPIPPKYHVHHLNGDKSNNTIENLTLLHTSEHARLHRKEYIEKNKEKFKEHLDNIRPLAVLAHKTKENRLRKSQRRKHEYETNNKIKSKCKLCGIDIQYTKGFKKKVFCGSRCAASTQARKDKKNQREREKYRLLHESIKE